MGCILFSGMPNFSLIFVTLSLISLLRKTLVMSSSVSLQRASTLVRMKSGYKCLPSASSRTSRSFCSTLESIACNVSALIRMITQWILSSSVGLGLYPIFSGLKGPPVSSAASVTYPSMIFPKSAARRPAPSPSIPMESQKRNWMFLALLSLAFPSDTKY